MSTKVRTIGVGGNYANIDQAIKSIAPGGYYVFDKNIEHVIISNINQAFYDGMNFNIADATILDDFTYTLRGERPNNGIPGSGTIVTFTTGGVGTDLRFCRLYGTSPECTGIRINIKDIEFRTTGLAARTMFDVGSAASNFSITIGAKTY